ncbi:hypothetical protein DES43_102231 [Aquamicrobium defluvii]|uniref:Response regulatory domain-containing protein n=1 Tax=Aquamicrobium defluvii TaxID=69279 RepID=A0A4R6YKM6_9HYPH|nr:hypothetical protein DES43_102231 [Aquamicrobium defluvii]
MDEGGIADLSRVMVVGRSRITQVVVAKIVQGLGLRPLVESPESAVQALRSMLPGIVVLDGGPENRDCDPPDAGACGSAPGHGRSATGAGAVVDPHGLIRQPFRARPRGCGGGQADHAGAVAARAQPACELKI